MVAVETDYDVHETLPRERQGQESMAAGDRVADV